MSAASLLRDQQFSRRFEKPQLAEKRQGCSFGSKTLFSDHPDLMRNNDARAEEQIFDEATPPLLTECKCLMTPPAPHPPSLMLAQCKAT